MKIRYQYWSSLGSSPSAGQLCLPEDNQDMIQSFKPLVIKAHAIQSAIKTDLKSVGIHVVQIQITEIESNAGVIYNLNN